MSKPYKRTKDGVFSYIYPPRPEHKISANTLEKFDDGTYYAQPKLNGSCCELYIDPKSYTNRNRHQGDISNFKMNDEEILKLHRKEGDMVLVGEYMNKSQNDINGKVFNNKFVIFDILVLDGQYLVGSTCEERYELLKELFGTEEYD